MISARDLLPLRTPPRRSGRQPSYRVHLDFPNGLRVRVSFESPDPARMLARRYAHHCVAPGERISLALDVFREDRSQIFALSPGTSYRWPRGMLTDHQLAFLSDAAVTTAAFSRLSDGVALHAASLAYHEAGIALLGGSGAGKTTTAIACALSGFTLYSDEFCVVHDGTIQPFARCVSLRPGGLELLRHLPGISRSIAARFEHHAKLGWADARYDELFGEFRSPAPQPLRAVFAIVGHARTPQLRRATAAALLPSAARYAKNASIPHRRVAEIFELLHSVRCYELTVGDPQSTVSLLARAAAERLE